MIFLSRISPQKNQYFMFLIINDIIFSLQKQEHFSSQKTQLYWCDFIKPHSYTAMTVAISCLNSNVYPQMFPYKQRLSSFGGLSAFCTKSRFISNFHCASCTDSGYFSTMKTRFFAVSEALLSQKAVFISFHSGFSRLLCNFFLAKLHLNVYNFDIIILEAVPNELRRKRK